MRGGEWRVESGGWRVEGGERDGMDEKRIDQIIGIIDSKSWPMVESGGELVLVDVPGRPGAKQKMRKAEAIALGLWKEPEAVKASLPARNKARRPGKNKVKSGE
jgi:hypothetical protein